MAILDFLKTKKGSPESQIGDLEKNLGAFAPNASRPRRR